MRIAFAGTPAFAEKQLVNLLKNNFDVCVVYTQPDKPAGRGQHATMSPVKQLALQYHIPVEQPFTLRNPDAHTILARYQPEIMIVAAYGLLLPRAFLNVPPLGCVNVHASLLPRWRGASPIQQTILAGDSVTGVTLMQMDEGLDTGSILLQAQCDILSTDTTQILYDRLATLGAECLVDMLHRITPPIPRPQDPALATYAPKITKAMAECRWEQPALEIERQIRAFQPWPILHTRLGGQSLRLWEARVVPLTESALPGTILAHERDGIIVATAEQGLLITRAQLPSKTVLPMGEILKSKHTIFAVGARFGA